MPSEGCGSSASFFPYLLPCRQLGARRVGLASRAGKGDALSVMATVDLLWVGLPTDARPNHPAECERLLHAKRASGQNP